MLTLFNWYAASYALIMLSGLELIIVAWIYGKCLKSFLNNIALKQLFNNIMIP